ncbi:general substrate transporter [Sporodiniella umbellata]|nr:general substrate transporter [Sporodiniella umbellata]
MPTFPTYFGIQGDPITVATMKGNVVSLLQAGCCVGALLVNFITDSLGRKWTIVISSLVFIIGSILQVAAQNLSTMMVGRFFGGMGIGACSMLVPMYIAEISPRNMRGRLGTLWQFLIVLGIMISYWVDYGCLRHIPPGNTQWRIPLGIQIAPGAILCIGMAFLPESLRWLALHGKKEQVLKNLTRLRDLPENHPEIVQELQEIEMAVEMERQATSGKWTELFERENLHRLIIGVMLQIFQQWTGSNAINYYGPDIFRSIGLNSNDTDVLATGVYGAVKVAFVFITFFFVDNRMGRRQTLVLGSVIQMAAFFILGGMILGLQKDNNGKLGINSDVGAKGYVAMVCIYVFAIGFEISWGPIVWIVCSEIYPTRIRAISLSITTAFNWAMNATIAKVVPIMMNNISYGTYFFFGSMAVVMGAFAYLFLPETRGKSLEEIDELFSHGKVWGFKQPQTTNRDESNELQHKDEKESTFKEKSNY